MRTQLVISLDGASQIQEGDEAEIFVNSDQMHLFDPSTGENLTLDTSARGRSPEATPWPRPRRSREVQDQRAALRSRRRSRRPEPQRGSRLRRSSPGIGRRLTVTPAIRATPLTRTVG